MAKYGLLRVALAPILTLIILAPCAFATSKTIASTDRLPLGDWTYDAMMSLAADGLTPGMPARAFQGERRFSRMEMARAVASVIHAAQSTNLNAKQRVLLEHLVSDFEPELAEIDPDVADKWSSESADRSLPLGARAFVTGYFSDMTSDDSLNADDSRTSYRASAFLNVSDSAFGMVTLADSEERFFHDRRTSANLDKAVVVGENRGISWLVGRAYLNWGPAYSGSLILSDNAPAFWQIRAGKAINFGKLIGTVKITQFASTFEDHDQTLYLFGRRYEKRLSERWHLAVSETAKMNTNPNPLIMVMPFYLYQHLFLDEDSNINNLLGVDLCYRTPRGAEIYGELLVDDMTAPRIIGADYSRPRKTGYTLGFSAPNVIPGDRYSSFTAEYITVDPLTYGATRDNVPELAYVHDTQIIGHPIGPNARALYLRTEYSVSDRINLIGEYLNQRQKESGPPETGSRSVLSFTTDYDITPGSSVRLRVAPYRITPPNSSTEHDTSYELAVSFAF